MKCFRWMIAVLALLAAGAVVAEGKVFDTADNPRAHGLHLQVSYPENWKVLKPKGDVLFAIGYGHNNVAEVMELMVDIMPQLKARSFFAMRDGVSKKTRERTIARFFKKYSGMELVAFSDVVVNGYPAVVLDLQKLDEKSAQPLFMRVKKKMVYAGGKVVLMNYVVMARPKERERVVARYGQGEAGDAGAFFESLVFKDSVPKKRPDGGKK